MTPPRPLLPRGAPRHQAQDGQGSAPAAPRSGGRTTRCWRRRFFPSQDEGIRFRANVGGVDGEGSPNRQGRQMLAMVSELLGEEFKARVRSQEAARGRTKRAARGGDGPGR